MREELINECLRLKSEILHKCAEISSYDSTCSNMMKIVIDNIDTPKNSDDNIRVMPIEELESLKNLFEEVLMKTDNVLVNMNKAIEKMNPPVIDEKKQKQELIRKSILNRLKYLKYRIFSFFRIDIK